MLSLDSHYITFKLIAEAKHSSVDVKTIAVNFTEGQSIYAKLRSELNKLKVGVLVNNVGTADGNRYDWMPEESVHDLVNCNIMSMTRMCHLILPQMIERKSGVIINIGSLSSATATPYLTLYGASKVHRLKFTHVTIRHVNFVNSRRLSTNFPKIWQPK